MDRCFFQVCLGWPSAGVEVEEIAEIKSHRSVFLRNVATVTQTAQQLQTEVVLLIRTDLRLS